MGLDVGLEKAGLEPVVCVENDEAAVQTIKANRPNLPVFGKSIIDVTSSELLQAANLQKNTVDLVVGGPPCQAFSVFGNRLGIKDARGQMIFEFLRVVEETLPHAFLLENVRGLLSMSILPKKTKSQSSAEPKKYDDIDYYKSGSLIELLFREFNRIGYRIDCFVVNSVNYGAPQQRERLLIIGNRHGLKAHFPEPTHSNREEDGLLPFKTLGDVIAPHGGWHEPSPEVMDFSPRKKRYLSMVPPGGNWRSLPLEIQQESMGKSWYLKGGRSAYWRKLSYDFPCPTIVTMPNHAGTSMCHPDELRAISVKEAAAVQEFPKDWIFCGSTTEKFRQIGNAVPSRLGKIAGEQLTALLEAIKLGQEATNQYPPYTITHIRPHVRTRKFWKAGKAFAGGVSYYGDLEDDEQLELDCVA